MACDTMVVLLVLAANAKNITLSSTVFPKVYAKWEKELDTRPDSTNKTFTGFVNDMLLFMVERDDWLETNIPEYSLVGYTTKQLFIKDSRKSRLAEVTLKSSKLYCELDKSTDCEHVHYAMMRPEVAKLKADMVKLF
jgi:hypothetical protein